MFFSPVQLVTESHISKDINAQSPGMGSLKKQPTFRKVAS